MATFQPAIDQCTTEEREAILGVAYCVAFADRRFWREKPLLDEIRRKLAIPAKTARRLKKKAADRRLELVVPHGEAARRLAYHYALAVAASDGKLSKGELDIAELLGGHLGVSKEEVAAELEGLPRAAERPSRHRRRSGPKGPREPKGDKYPALLAGLVDGQAEAAAGGLSFLKSPSGIVMVLANLVPLFGVWFFAWDVFTIMLLYWLENAVVGLFAILKMFLGAFLYPEGPGGSRESSPLAMLARAGACLFLVAFFVFHFGMFMYGHAVFLFAFFRADVPVGSLGELLAGVQSVLSAALMVALAALLVEHGFFFLFDHVAGRKYLAIDPPSAMFQPYPRLAVLHVTIIVGMFPFLMFSLPSAFLVVLITAKTAMDFRLAASKQHLFRP